MHKAVPGLSPQQVARTYATFSGVVEGVEISMR
jgi:hypothetical protein